MVFSGRGGRRPRCHSCLSFQSLIRRPSSHPGGDPFSHPSGSSVSRPAWVTVRSAARGLLPARSARPPPGRPGARKHSVPNRVHSVGNDLGARAAFRQCVQPVADSWLGRITLNFSLGHSPWRAWGLGRPAAPIQFCWLGGPDPFAGSRPVSPKSFFLGRPEDAHGVVGHIFPSSRATRPWPVCRPVT